MPRLPPSLGMQQPAAGFYYARGRDYSTHNYLFNVVLTALLPGISRAFVSQLAASAQVGVADAVRGWDV